MRELHSHIRTFSRMNLSEIMTAYLRVESSFSLEYREKTQFILGQMFDLHPVEANKFNRLSIYTALDQNLLDLTQ
jgi:hypothetical protein